MPFPLIKLGYLALKHISKPLANTIKLKAKTTPFLRNRILLPAAQRKCIQLSCLARKQRLYRKEVVRDTTVVPTNSRHDGRVRNR